MWVKHKFFVIALLLATCCAAVPKRVHVRIHAVNALFQKFGNDSDLMEKCRENAAKGEKADPFITELCKRAGFDPNPKPDCPPLPPRPEPVDDHNVPLADRLNSGIAKMWSGLQNSTAAIFILGNTGSGKSTLAQILTGNLSHLYATELTDGGTMVIFDENDRIGAPTTVSYTVIPEYVVSSETKAGFWDCPGFDDTRGPDIDIASMYFLKTALDNIQQAKFLFTVSASSMKPGNDKLDFDLLATHASQLMKNLDQIASSIGLVVTKVPNYSDSGIFKTDEVIMNEFTKFLQTYLNTTEKKITGTDNQSEKSTLAKKAKFAEAILSGNKTAPDIAFIRNPDVCGSLDKIPSISKSKAAVTKLYQEELEYSSVSPSYFQVSLKTETILALETQVIPQTVARIQQEVAQSSSNVWQQFRQKLEHQIQKGDNPKILQIFSDVATDFTLRNSSASDFAESLQKIYSAFTSNQNETSITFIAEMVKQLRFFEFVSGKKIKIPDASWMEPLENLGNNFTDLQEFYKFCQNLDVDLGSYKKQVAFTALVKDDTKANFTVNNTLEFLIGNNLARIPSEIEILWKTKLSTIDKVFMAKIVQDKVPNTKLACEKSAQFEDKYHLQISGTNVKFTDFLPNSRTFWPGSCSSWDQIKEISVFARDSVFLDYDLNANCSNIQLSILAPTWEVIGTDRTIFLGCFNYQEKIPDAASGQGYGDWGSNGRNGRPGVNVGSFFGVSTAVKHATNLTIVVDGGDGESGQNGGKGGNGKIGSNATDEAFGTFHFDDKVLHIGYVDKDGYLALPPGCLKDGTDCWYTKFGDQGSKGGNGGRGGNGGPPGNPGNISLVDLASSSGMASKIGISNKLGRPGSPGKGGAYGEGGPGGFSISCHLYVVPVIKVYKWDQCFFAPNPTWGRNRKYGPNGENGKDGESNSTPIPKQKTAELWPVVNQYKKRFLGERARSKLFREMEQSSKIMELLKAQAFAEELVNLEKFYFKAESQEKAKLAENYNQFLNRIVVYAKMQNGSISTDDKIVLNFVYTAALGKIAAIKGSMNTVKVTNTLEYFKILAKEAKILSTKQRDVAIAEETANYEQILNEKISEAKKYINTLALPALAKAEKMEQKAQADLIKEVNKYLEAAQENLEMQQKIKSDFESSLPLRNILGGLKVVGAFCNVLGPEGQILGAVVESGATVADSLLLKPVPDPPDFELPVGFTTEVGKLSKTLLEEKTDILTKQIDVILEETSNCGGVLDDLKRIAEEVKTEMGKIRGSAEAGKYLEGIVDSLKRLDQLSENLRSEVSKVAENGDQIQYSSTGSHLARSHVARNHTAGSAALKADDKDKKKEREELAKKMEKVLKLVTAGVDFGKKIGENKSKLEKLVKLVEQAEKQVKMVEARKRALYESIFPALEQMSADIIKQSEQASDKSLVALTVQRWNLQNLVKTMSRDLQRFTKGMAVQEEFQLAMDQMEQAVNLVVTLYEHVERYQEKKQMAGFIANINLAQDQRSQIKDNEVKKLLAELDFAITANIFVEDYQRAMTAFKQWAFPFAGNYLDKREELVDNWDTLRGKPYGDKAMQLIVATFKSKVEWLSTQLEKYYASTKSGDENLIVAKFIGGKRSTRPFFVWGNAQWNQSLRKLLQGQVVHLQADPETNLGTKRMLEGKGAVKYKSIEPHFTAIDWKLQYELDEMLKYFALEMKHCGVSVYAVSEKKYEITDASQTYMVCFEEDEKVVMLGDKLCENVVLNKTGDYLMSPYTWWTFQLIDMDPDHGLSFGDLETKFGEKVNLELWGSGIYLDEKRAGKEFVERLDLDAFYEPMEKSEDFL